jgi:hypothetical protein
MKNKLSDLHDLIKMMTGTEKRGFMLELKSGIKGDKKRPTAHMLIFQALDKMGEFDETQFQKGLRKAIHDDSQFEKIIARLPIERLHLFNRLMRYLRSANSGYYPSMQVKELIIDAKLLMERGLFRLAQQALDKAREIALEHENSLGILEINREQRTIMYSIVEDRSMRKAMLKDLIAENETQFRQLEQEIYYQDLYDLSAVFMSREAQIIEYQDVETTMDKLSKAEHLLDQLDTLPSLSGYRLLGAFSILVIAKGDLKARDKNFKQLVEWWEAHPRLIAENPFRYLLSMGNALERMVSKKDAKGFFSLHNKIMKRVVLLPHRELAECRFILPRELFWYTNVKNLDKAYEIAKEIEVRLKKFGAVIPINLRMVMEYNICILYFVSGKFREALAACGKMKRYEQEVRRRDVLYQAELFGLICIYEISAGEDDGSDTLNNRFRRVNRLFKQHALADDSFEMTLLALHRQIMYAGWEKRKEAITAMKDYLKLRTDSYGKRVTGVEEHLIWLESLTQGRNIREIYLEIQF